MGMLEEKKMELAEKLKARVAKVEMKEKEVDETCVLLVDVSSSMGEPVKLNNGISKLEAVRRAIPALRVSGATVMYGLVGFCDRAIVFQPLTLNFGQIICKGEEMVSCGSTNITDGLRCGLSIMSGKEANKRRMVLLSDGQANREREGLWDVVSRCARAGVVVDTIAFGDRADRETLKRIAEATGGLFVDATDFVSLKKAYEKLNFHVRYLELKKEKEQ